MNRMSIFIFVCTALLVVGSAEDLPTIGEFIQESGGGNFDVLQALVGEAGLHETIASMEDITILAPTDSAFIETANSLGCENVTTDSEAIKCFSEDLPTIFDSLPSDYLSQIIKYHVLPVQTSFKEIIRGKPILMTLLGEMIRSRKLMLIDLTSGIRNARFIGGMTADGRFQGGVVHAIDGVLLPFQNLIGSTDPCVNLGNPVVLVTRKFIMPRVYIRNVKKCDSVRRAIMECDYDMKCENELGSTFVTAGIDVGDIIAAGTTCMKAAELIRKGC